MNMGFVNTKQQPEMIYKAINSKTSEDIENITKWVNNINRDLVDSGYDRYQAKVELIGNAAYIKRL